MRESMCIKVQQDKVLYNRRKRQFHAIISEFAGNAPFSFDLVNKLGRLRHFDLVGIASSERGVESWTYVCSSFRYPLFFRIENPLKLH
jgi:hypothetical protein